MAIYRSNQVIEKSPVRTQPQAQAQAATQAANQKTSKVDENGEKQIAVNGYQQVVEMLSAADPAFRESLLSRIGRRDPELARRLREHF